MAVLLLVSLKANIQEIKQIKFIVSDLILLEKEIVFFNVKGANQDIKKYLMDIQYPKYKYVGDWNSTYDKLFQLITKQNIEQVIVIGLGYHDLLTNYLDNYIGTNIDLYLIASNYGKLSDATTLINQGALLLSTRYDLI